MYLEEGRKINIDVLGIPFMHQSISEADVVCFYQTSESCGLEDSPYMVFDSICSAGNRATLLACIFYFRIQIYKVPSIG